jgi:hypothetical protein
MIRIWHMWMQPDIFAGTAQLVRDTIGDGWAETVRRNSDLEL